MKIVFIGDSITEEGRFEDPEGIGYGYVRIIRDYLEISYPDKRFEVLNKGVSGNRIHDLLNRWEEDVIALKPDVLSISIGVNDAWRQLDHPEMKQIYPDEFAAIYRDLLTQTKEKTDTRIFLMEPTVLQENPDSTGNQLLKPYVAAVQEMGKMFQLPVVPLHQVFTDLLLKGVHQLTTDGVHMTSKGDLLMAKTWLETFLKTVKL